MALRTEWRIASDRLAIVAADGVFSYYDLAAAAARVAAELTRGSGPRDGARVAFLVPPSFAYVVISRGIWLAGGVAVPLAVSHPPAELEHVFESADCLSIGLFSQRRDFRRDDRVAFALAFEHEQKPFISVVQVLQRLLARLKLDLLKAGMQACPPLPQLKRQLL